VSALITRCPLCQTAFRVTTTQISAADGLVRCGACTHVFQAERNLVAAEPALSDAAAANGAAVADWSIEESYIHEMLLGPASRADEADAQVPASIAEADASADARTAEPAPGAGGDTPRDDTHTATAADQVAPSSFAPPPIEIAATAPPRRASLGWALSSAAAALLLLAQIAWHERDRLVRDAHWRPRLAAACAVFGCSLPKPAAPELLRTDGLVIRPAPGREGVLLVDALISNRATYEQPWPGFELVFFDMRDRPLAGRVFAPSEYLPATAPDAMPVRQAVAVRLEIRDPGETATNYRPFLRGYTSRE